MMHSANVLGVEIDQKGAMRLPRRSRGTPRLANRLLKRVRDLPRSCMTAGSRKRSLEGAGSSGRGQDGTGQPDRKILTTMIDKFGGGPVGLSNLAAAIGEDAGTLEDVYEPYLIKNGFLIRTPSGRVVTELAYSHLGLPVPS